MKFVIFVVLFYMSPALFIVVVGAVLGGKVYDATKTEED